MIGLALLLFDDGMQLRGCQAVLRVAAEGGSKRSDAVVPPSAAARGCASTAGLEAPLTEAAAEAVVLAALYVAAECPLFLAQPWRAVGLAKTAFALAVSGPVPRYGQALLWEWGAVGFYGVADGFAVAALPAAPEASVVWSAPVQRRTRAE